MQRSGFYVKGFIVYCLLHQERKMHLIFKTAVMVYFKTPPSTEEKIEGRVKVTGRRGKRRTQILDKFNPLNAELNPICHLLALLGAHHILHISRIKVKEKRILEMGRGSTRSHCVENSLWKSLWFCRKRDCR